jgi:hypothetical protein
MYKTVEAQDICSFFLSPMDFNDIFIIQNFFSITLLCLFARFDFVAISIAMMYCTIRLRVHYLIDHLFNYCRH